MKDIKDYAVLKLQSYGVCTFCSECNKEIKSGETYLVGMNDDNCREKYCVKCALKLIKELIEPHKVVISELREVALKLVVKKEKKKVNSEEACKKFNEACEVIRRI
jgi:hypothetical protein